jgi:putative glutamine amidotransferase
VAQNRPPIGLTSDVRVEKRKISFLFDSYSESVERAGGIPLQIPPLAERGLAAQVLAAVSGVVIVGGEDIDPRLYGETPLPTHKPLAAGRLDFDLALARELLAGDLPVLGICYGCQLLAVASGGSLYQDIPSQVPDAVPHQGTFPDLPTHLVDINPDSRLRRIVGADRIEVNSAHHQAPRTLGEGLLVSARSPDDVIEAIEAPGDRFLVGVEWHPDLLADREDQQRLFEALVEAAARHRGA